MNNHHIILWIWPSMWQHKHMADGCEQENMEREPTALGSNARTVRQLTGEATTLGSDVRTVRQLTGEVAALANNVRTVGWSMGETAGAQSIWTVTGVESLREWENSVGESERDSSGASRKVQQRKCDGRERERCGESDNGQKVRHAIVALREIADKSWELVNSSNKRLNNGEWTGWNQ